MEIRPGKLVQRRLGGGVGVLMDIQGASDDAENKDCEVAFGYLSVADAKKSDSKNWPKIKLKHLKAVL